MLISATHFFGRTHELWMKWPLQDRRYSSRLDGKYNRKARLATKNYVSGKRGAITDLRYRGFHKEILPGLSYAKLGCPPPWVIIDGHNKVVDIWVQQQGNTDYRSRINSDPGDFIKFSIPNVVLQKIREWGRQAKDMNKQIDARTRENGNQ